jgi:glycosyltransferase involved in cell wall biosynthesis
MPGPLCVGAHCVWNPGWENCAVPRVSVIIPAHDAAPFIEQALASVHRQTYSDWEVVAVDDGSSDATWELLQAAGARVRSFRREHAGGPGVARNLALRNINAELVAFLDADDLLLPRYLESQLACYEAARVRGAAPVGLVTCDARISIEGQLVSYTHLDRVPDRYAPLTLARVLRRNPIYTACLVPAAVGEAVGWFDPELFAAEDYALWIKILESGYRAVLNDEVLAVYRRTAGAVSSNIAGLGVDNRRAYQLALRRGRLTPRQQRIARQAIRYNRAMEAVALLRFAGAGQRRASLPRLRDLPLLGWVALSNPRMWQAWLQLLWSGRADDAAKLRAHP